MNGYKYERFCAGYLSRQGFRRVTVTKKSGDQGIDIIAYKKFKKYGFQCKYYSAKVGNKAVQEAYSGAAFHNCDFAGVITNSEFTAPARALAEKTGVILIDGLRPGIFGRIGVFFSGFSKKLILFFIALVGAFLLYSHFAFGGDAARALERLLSVTGLSRYGFFEKMPSHLAGYLIGFAAVVLTAVVIRALIRRILRSRYDCEDGEDDEFDDDNEIPESSVNTGKEPDAPNLSADGNAAVDENSG